MKDFNLSRIVLVTKMGAEGIIEKKDGFIGELERAIDESVPASITQPISTSPF
jgi:hypothetical protein